MWPAEATYELPAAPEVPAKLAKLAMQPDQGKLAPAVMAVAISLILTAFSSLPAVSALELDNAVDVEVLLVCCQ